MKRYAILAVVLPVIVAANLYLRLFPAYLPQLKMQAGSDVRQRLHREAAREIDRRFGGYGMIARSRLAEELFRDYRKQRSEEIQRLSEEQFRVLKSRFQDPSGRTYLLELDGWHWARYVENVLRLGHPGDIVEGGKQVDTLMLAPSGFAMRWDQLLFYLSAFLYKVWNAVVPVPLATFIFYLPVFFASIFIVTLYLFCFYRWGNLGASVTCLFAGLAPIFLARSSAGWFDMDALNLLFPLLVVWTYLSTYARRGLARRLAALLFSALWVALFCSMWWPWWFILIIVIAYELYTLVNICCVYLQYKEDNGQSFKEHALNLLCFLVFVFVLVTVMCGLDPWRSLFGQLKVAATLNKPLTASIWPNTGATIGELKAADFLQVCRSIGGVWLFGISFVSMVVLFLRSREYTGFTREVIVVLVFWFMGMFYACFRGIRFAMFLIVPLGVSFGWAVSETYQYWKGRKKRLGVVSVLAAAGICCGIFIHTGSVAARGIFPLMNDTWYTALTKIKESTPDNAVVNSWWDFGDWFKAVSGRKVIFDGQSQSSPRAYWMAHVLLSQDEREAVGILRMLNNGGDSLFEPMAKHLKDPLKAILLLKKAIALEHPEARQALLQSLPAHLADAVFTSLTAKPPPAYFVVDYTMPDKFHAFSFLGNWDFIKGYLLSRSRAQKDMQALKYLKELGVDGNDAERLFRESLLIPRQAAQFWVSPIRKFYSPFLEGREREGIIFFDNGLVYNSKARTIYHYMPGEAGFLTPVTLFIAKEDTSALEEIRLADGNADVSVLVSETKGAYRAIMLDRELAQSLFVRLYFLGGRGLAHFKERIDEREGANHIRVFEILWE